MTPIKYNISHIFNLGQLLASPDTYRPIPMMSTSTQLFLAPSVIQGYVTGRHYRLEVYHCLPISTDIFTPLLVTGDPTGTFR